MSNRYLPFYSNFFGTFEKYTIEEWEAKDFIANVLGNDLNTEKINKKFIKESVCLFNVAI